MLSMSFLRLIYAYNLLFSQDLFGRHTYHQECYILATIGPVASQFNIWISSLHRSVHPMSRVGLVFVRDLVICEYRVNASTSTCAVNAGAMSPAVCSSGGEDCCATARQRSPKFRRLCEPCACCRPLDELSASNSLDV